MSRIDEFLELIDNPTLPPLVAGPDDAHLLQLVAHIAFSDGDIGEDELALMRRLIPGALDHELEGWIHQTLSVPIDYEGLSQMCQTPETRVACLRLATRMAAMDGEIADEEWAMLNTLAEHLRMAQHAVRQCITEVMGAGGDIDRRQIARALQSMLWDELVPSRGELQGPLCAVIPPNATSVATMSHGDEEMAGLYFEGFALTFADGPAFIKWKHIIEYTRVPVPGASMHVRTADDRLRTVSDPRLKDIGKLLDLIYGRAELAAI